MTWAADTMEHDWGLKHRVDMGEISREELLPIISAMAGEAVTDFLLVGEREQKGNKGFYGYKPVLTFAWTTITGRQGENVCCVKTGQPESRNYAELTRLGVPVCPLYGFVARPENERNQQEILFLEYLEPVGLNENDPEHLKRFLAIKAHLHSVTPSPEYIAFVRQQEFSRTGRQEDATQFAARIRGVWEQVWESAAAGALGTDFEIIQSEHAEFPAFMERVAFGSDEAMAQAPCCLNCTELNPGWRRGTGEMVCFDLHGVGYEPRFADLTHLFGTPDGVHDGWQVGWRPREELAVSYLQKLREYGGPDITPEELFTATRLSWTRHAVDQGWWLSRSLTGEDGCRDDMLSVTRYFLHSSGEDAGIERFS